MSCTRIFHLLTTTTLIFVPTLLSAAHAAPKPHMSPGKTVSSDTQNVKMVAYDAKDKRYYSVAWAKAHGMHDKGGDPLTIVPFSSLPKDAKESKAMLGAKI